MLVWDIFLHQYAVILRFSAFSYRYKSSILARRIKIENGTYSCIFGPSPQLMTVGARHLFPFVFWNPANTANTVSEGPVIWECPDQVWYPKEIAMIFGQCERACPAQISLKHTGAIWLLGGCHGLIWRHFRMVCLTQAAGHLYRCLRGSCYR